MSDKLPKLKPCPFCGGTEIKILSNGIGDYYALCDTDDEGEMSCGVRTSDYRCETKLGAIERWNNRAKPQTRRTRSHG